MAGDAKGIIKMIGMSHGIGLSLSLGGLFGYMSSKSSIMPWEMDLRDSPEETGISFRSVSRDESIIKLPADILFGFDKDWIGSGRGRGRGGKREAEQALHVLGFVLSVWRPKRIFTEGHTDSKGPAINGAQYNMVLSERRALAVKNWLIAKGYVAKMPIDAIGFGLTKPVADNTRNGKDYPEGRELNRRVEVRILG